jgi:phage tail sheath protein FI
MARLKRICPPGIPQHIIQRGNNRQVCFASEEDFTVYAHWLDEENPLVRMGRSFYSDPKYQRNNAGNLAMAYKTPGVYVKEVSVFPPSVAEVETAIPAFIGYTERAKEKGEDLTNKPKCIKSLVEFEQFFGGPARPKTLKVQLDAANKPTRVVTIEHHYQLYYSLRLFFDNGGGDCYIVSVGPYAGGGTKTKADLEAGVDAIHQYDEPTLILFPDAALTGGSDLTDLQKKTLLQCAELQDRFGVFDLDESGGHSAGVTAFRNNIGINDLKYGAAYTPHLRVSIPVQFIYQDISLEQGGAATNLAMVTAAAGIDATSVTAIDTAVTNGNPQDTIDSLAVDLKNTNSIYAGIVKAIQQASMILPPSGAVVGVYARVDNDRGVWKAPANVSLNSVIASTVAINDADQESLNVDVNAGKSINAIRTFTGRGTLIWGARTLAGNDNEWRYISVRRFFNMVEESIKKSTAWAVFEPNAAPLWTKTKSMIGSYLTQKWREGALAGAKSEDAFFVKIGLDETMTAQDILEGRMTVEIGMAVLRPAEFIILKFSHKMQES